MTKGGQYLKSPEESRALLRDPTTQIIPLRRSFEHSKIPFLCNHFTNSIIRHPFYLLLHRPTSSPSLEPSAPTGPFQEFDVLRVEVQ